jgi:hypothetical protein
MRFSALDVAFVLWLVASAVNQLEMRWWRGVAARDLFGLLPKWTFFAPRPGTDDTRLVFRDVLKDDGYSAWMEVPTFPARSVWVRMFWNPEKLDGKALCDLAQLLALHVEDSQSLPKAALVSLPYIQLLDSVMQMPRGGESTARQFALVRTQGHVPPRQTNVLLLSQVHNFELA